MKKITLAPSKSLVNRALILASYQEEDIFYSLQKFCTNTDTAELFHALHQLRKGENRFHISLGATPFHFLIARLSKETGDFFIETTLSLQQRPHQALFAALEKLGCLITQRQNGYHIQAKGWKKLSSLLEVDCSLSSQYASALALNVEDQRVENIFSFIHLNPSYFDLTKQAIEKKDDLLTLLEIDMSSAFSLVASKIWKADFVLENFPLSSKQPDFIFVEMMQKMGFSLEQKEECLHIRKMNQEALPICVDISSSPDLLPVLAALCACAKGTSLLKGVARNLYKESNRVSEVIKLLKLLGVHVDYKEDTLCIQGPYKIISSKIFYDPASDHRMAMAAAVFVAQGVSLEIFNRDVVNKSYPSFWKEAEL